MQRWDEHYQSGKVIWERDVGAAYEVDKQALIERPDGTCVFIYASGCSCWDGDASVEVYACLADALNPLGIPRDFRDDSLRDLQDGLDRILDKL